MKKEDILGTFAYILMLGLAAIYIFVVLGPRASESGLGEFYFLFNLGGLIAGTIFHAIIFEVAHVIGAKIGGYLVTYVSVFGITLKKDAGKWKFSFSDFRGLTGETRIAPNRKDINKCNPYPYLLGGTITYIIELIIVLVLFFMYKDEMEAISNVVYFLLDMIVVGSMFVLYNIIPAKLDCITDGYNLSLFANPKNREAYHELLRVNYELSLGNNVEIKVFDEITNFTTDLNMNKVYMFYREDKYDEAEKIIDKIISERESISYDVYLRVKSEKIFIKFMNLPSEEIASYYAKEVSISERHDIASTSSISCIRAYLLMSGLGDKSRSECIVSLNKVNKALKRSPKTIRDIEIKLFNSALQKVCDAHEKWELNKYLINTKK